MSDERTLSSYPVHLAADGSIAPLSRFTGDGPWYGEYEDRFRSDGPAGRLVSWHTFDRSWNSWEMHPSGEELVVCVSGSIELVQEVEGAERATTLRAGEWIVNGVGVWHTANIGAGETAVCMFITSGLGTQGRER